MTTAPSGSEISCGAMLSTVVQVAHGVRTDRHPMLGITRSAAAVDVSQASWLAAMIRISRSAPPSNATSAAWYAALP